MCGILLIKHDLCFLFWMLIHLNFLVQRVKIASENSKASRKYLG